MKNVFLGSTGTQVSQLCYGTMSFGGDADEAESKKLFARCRDAGINFFDCANVYNKGRAEEILGRLIAGSRDELVITSKFAGRSGPDVNARGASRRNMMLSVEASLRRLNTDRLDVYFAHRFDEETPLEDTLRAFDDLVRQGKILYPGCSNYTAWQTMKALGVSAKSALAPFKVLQPMYNLVKRTAEVEILPLAQAENLAVIPYSPIGGGLLSGKHGPGSRPSFGRFVQNPRYATRYNQDWMLQTAVDFTAFAGSLGHHPVSLAVAWVGAHPGVTAPIIGARNVGQLDDALKSTAIEVDKTLWRKIADLALSPPVATDRSEEA